MVGFQHEKVRARQRGSYLGGGTSQIRGNSHPGLCLDIDECHGDRIRRIVHRDERFDPDAADLEGVSGTVRDDALLSAQQRTAGCSGAVRHVERRTVPA